MSEDRPTKPKLLDIRWVCKSCLRVIHEPLDVSWVWVWDRAKEHQKGFWQPGTITSPRCHDAEMLILGEPKVDVHGLYRHGMVIDPLHTMPCPKAKVA